jgi:hypothetical protein
MHAKIPFLVLKTADLLATLKNNKNQVVWELKHKRD